MIRLIAVFLIFAVFLAFIIFNLNNKCDVSLGFKTFEDIPIFLSAIFSFALGLFFSVPMVFSLRGKKQKKSSKTEPSGAKTSGAKIKDDPPAVLEPIKKIDSSYGID